MFLGKTLGSQFAGGIKYDLHIVLTTILSLRAMLNTRDKFNPENSSFRQQIWYLITKSVQVFFPWKLWLSLWKITEKSLPIKIIGGHLSWQLRLVPTSIRISCQCRGFFSPVDFFQVLTSQCVFHALVSFKFYRREGGGWVRRRIRHAIRLKWEEGLFGKKVAAASVLINWDIVSGLCLLCFWDFLRSVYQNVVCFSL